MICKYFRLIVDQQQHFGQVHIDEDQYISDILDFIEEAETKLPPELSRIVKKTDFVVQVEQPEIGCLRLQPKIQKMKNVDFEHIHQLKSRGIKSSMKDPIKRIQIVLNRIFEHLLYFVEKEFHNKFGKLSPSVTGTNEALERIRGATSGPCGKSLEGQSDFSDLYSNCSSTLLIAAVKRACILAEFSQETIDYILDLIEVNMAHSYFKEPAGIFHTESGFSMGDICAASGSELILRISELDTYQALSDNDLFQFIKWYLRFRDDISFHLTGPMCKIMETMKIISTTYPAGLQLNTEISGFSGRFLNIRIYNSPSSTDPVTSIFRKSQCKFVIIPPNSNTDPSYKKCAGHTYFDMIRSNCSTQSEASRQFGIVETILTLKGFNTAQINRMKKQKRLSRLAVENKQRLYIGKVTFDNLVSTHKYMRNIFKIPEFDQERFSLPMKVPGRKLLQYIFTIRKMRKKLNF